MKIIEVNKFCKVNQENIAHSIDREVAINIIAENDDDIDFNYMLAIESGRCCCETYGVFLKKLHTGDDEVFITKIEHDATISKELLKELDEYTGFDFRGEYIGCNVYGTGNKLLYTAFVYNEHNGYYAHFVYTDINGNLEIEYL